mmetsp:Transcript_82254/g.199412  ORF Transcript_82254/g.199412 Transcript_82254/m.199412 type:complete len:393 (+) Transcript_82254:116-1294(+)
MCLGQVSRDNEVYVLASSYTDMSLLAHTPTGKTGDGLTVFRLDTNIGSLTRVSNQSVSGNPAFIVHHPANPNRLFVTTERIDKQGGDLLTFDLDAQSGRLTQLGNIKAGGRSTCHINCSANSDHLVLTHYWDARLSVVSCAGDGVPRRVESAVQQAGAEYVDRCNPTREEHWAHRQRWPHMHCAVTEPYQQRSIFVPDLGLDQILCFTLDPRTHQLQRQSVVQLQKGLGPRHLIFHPSHRAAFLINELESSISTFRFNESGVNHNGHVVDCCDPTSPLEWLDTQPTIPEDFQGKNTSSEIRLHPSGKWVVVGNRGHDSLAVFEVLDSGRIQLLNRFHTGGKCPRNFAFDQSGRWLVVGNQDSNACIVFEWDAGQVKETCRVNVPTPNYVHIL